jgi:FAD/FMN-containing dehydrogenase
VFEIRERLAGLFLERGAVHLQIGRTYPYRAGLAPAAWRLVEALKRAVDPEGRINPGSLGLDTDPRPSP